MNKENAIEVLRQFEQGSAIVADRFPVFWKRMYDQLLKEGFNEKQAFSLLKTFIKKRTD